MKTIVRMFSLFATTVTVLAQTTNIVVPNANANVEGNTNTSAPFSSSSFRLQQVFSASQFAIPPGASARVDRIYFRLEGLSSGNVLYTFGGGSVTLSATPRGPDSLSLVFNDNVGANAVTVYSGAMAFGGLYQAGADPQPFGNSVQSTASFWYIPSQGNLLLDIAGAGGQTLFPGALDAQSVTGDSISRVFATSDFASSGMADTLGLVTRIDFTVIPEPSTWFLALLGFLTTIFLKRRK